MCSSLGRAPPNYRQVMDELMSLAWARSIESIRISYFLNVRFDITLPHTLRSYKLPLTPRSPPPPNPLPHTHSAYAREVMFLETTSEVSQYVSRY